MANEYIGVNFTTLRKALYLLYFGVDNGACNDFSSEKYKYIIPMQGNFENPMTFDGKNTYMMYWIERDESLTQDDYVGSYNRQKCVADILIRFIGKEAETWARALRHLIKRDGVGAIWSNVCNAEKLEHTSPIMPRKIEYSGLNTDIAFDVRFRLYYDEMIDTKWSALEGIDIKTVGQMN